MAITEQEVDTIRMAAVGGDPTAQFRLGWLHHRGEGMEQDLGQAFAWWKKAAEQGLSVAMHNVGACYLVGEGIEKDLEQGALWHEKSLLSRPPAPQDRAAPAPQPA